MRPGRLLIAVVAMLLGSGANARADGGATDVHVAGRREPSTMRGYALGGVSAGGVFALSTTGGRAGGGIVFDRGHSSVRVGLEVDHGISLAGLTITHVVGAASREYVAGRFRVGGGGELGALWMTRLSDDPIGACGVGLFASLSVDLIDFGEHRALFLAVRPSASWLWGTSSPLDIGSGTAMWNVAALTGARF